MPDFGTPLKPAKSDEIEKKEMMSENSPMIEDVAAKVEVKGSEIDKIKSIDDEFDAIAAIKTDSKQEISQVLDVKSADKDVTGEAKIECMESLVAKVNQVEDGDDKPLLKSSPKKSD